MIGVGLTLEEAPAEPLGLPEASHGGEEAPPPSRLGGQDRGLAEHWTAINT